MIARTGRFHTWFSAGLHFDAHKSSNRRVLAVIGAAFTAAISVVLAVIPAGAMTVTFGSRVTTAIAKNQDVRNEISASIKKAGDAVKMVADAAKDAAEGTKSDAA